MEENRISRTVLSMEFGNNKIVQRKKLNDMQHDTKEMVSVLRGEKSHPSRTRENEGTEH
jgi:hypothetical protein